MLYSVMPDPVSSTGQARSGIQRILNIGFRLEINLSRECLSFIIGYLEFERVVGPMDV